MSNKEVATRVAVRPETVSRWRNEKRPVSPRNRPKLAEALSEAPGWFWDDNGVAIEAPADSSFLSSADEMEEVDETKESETRLRDLAATKMDENLLRHFELAPEQVAQEHERTGALSAHQIARKTRNQVQAQLKTVLDPAQRIQLYVLAAKLSTMLGYLAFERNDVALAHVYLNEACAFADAAGGAEAKASVRAWQSVVAYHSGKDKAALDYARDGRCHCERGPQASRLAVAEARALAHLGKAEEATAAIQQALELASDLPGPNAADCLLSFEPMGTGRIYVEAAGAYLDLGDAEGASHYAERALAAYEATDWRLTRALILADLALAHLSGEAADPGAAAARTREAIDMAHDVRSQLLAMKAWAIVIASRGWAKQPDMLDAAAQAEAWRKAVRPPSPPAGPRPPLPR